MDTLLALEPELADAALALALVLALALALILALVAVPVLVRLVRRVAAVDARLAAAGIPPSAPPLVRKGDPLPPFEAGTLAGTRIASTALLDGRRDVLLLFVSPACAPCRELLHELLQEFQYRFPHDVAHRSSREARAAPDAPPQEARARARGDWLVVITRGTPAENLAGLGLPARGDVLLQQGDELARRFGAATMPSAVRVRRDGIVAAPLAVGRAAILALAAGPHERGPRRPRISVLP